jgi:hypothetical protein
MIVTEISWDDMLDGQPLPESPARAAWRAAVAEVAERAKAALPAEVNGRIEQAVAMVLAGEVDLLPDGTATVTSQRDGTMESFVVNGTCPCPDFAIAPSGWCAHRLSAAIARRAYPLVKRKLEAATGTSMSTPLPQPVPEEGQGQPLVAPDIAPQFIVEIQGKPFIQFAGLLALAHTRGWVSLTADFITVTTDLALAHAVATFQDGRTFAESGDATPDNVNKKVRPHFARMALTRAKARCLRDALNIGMCSLEELAE